MEDVSPEMAAADTALDEVFESSTETVSEGAEETPQADTAEQVRDEQGRFASREVEEATDTDDTPEGTVESSADDTEEEATKEASEQVYPEFSYRADGQDVSIPGSRLGEDGMFVPTHQLPEVQRLLALGKHHLSGQGNVRWQKMASDLAQRDTTLQAEREGKAVLLQKLQELVADDDAFIAFREKARQNMAVLTAQAEARTYAVQLESQQAEADTLRFESGWQAAQPRLQNALRDQVVALAQQHGFNLEDPEDVESLTAYYRSRCNDTDLRTIFPRADRDYPEYGVAKGGLLQDVRGVDRDLGMLAQMLLPRKQAARQKAAKLTAAEAKNKEALTEPSKKPPTARAKTGPAPSSKKGFSLKADPRSREATDEVDQIFESTSFADL